MAIPEQYGPRSVLQRLQATIRCASDQAQRDGEPPYRRLRAAVRFRGVAFGRLLLRCSARRAPLAGVRILSWPSSHLIRYRGEGSPRTTSSTTPRRGWRLVDSDSAATRLPTSKAIVPPSSVDARLLADDTPRSAASIRGELDSGPHSGSERVGEVPCRQSDRAFVTGQTANAIVSDMCACRPEQVRMPARAGSRGFGSGCAEHRRTVVGVRD
jgi:hypothetical protein